MSAAKQNVGETETTVTPDDLKKALKHCMDCGLKVIEIARESWLENHKTCPVEINTALQRLRDFQAEVYRHIGRIEMGE